MLGAGFAPVTEHLRRERDLPDGVGVTIGSIFPHTTAARAGLQVGDVLLAIQGKSIADPSQVAPALAGLSVGGRLAISIDRGGRRMNVDAEWLPKPLDRGENYEVIYDHVVSNGHRIRTLVSRPMGGGAGKVPVLFLIQGVGPSSIDQNLDSPGAYSRILKAFNDRGYATVRVEKPGIGDSEGPPPIDLTYDRDVDAFRQALASLRRYSFMDLDRVFLFGHSMGGCHAPILAKDFAFRGIAVSGTVARPWHEYMVENHRRQSVLAGNTPGDVDRRIRSYMAVIHYLFTEGMSPDEVMERVPSHSAMVRSVFSDGSTLAGHRYPYWQELFRHDFGAYWGEVDTHVLALWGESEFIASEQDHPLIADIVNRRDPRRGVYRSLPQSDHGFSLVDSPAESFRLWGQPGKEFNPNIVEALLQWSEGLR
jgi:pimeloyl-ACP methyl ester carboxylesterase